MERAILNEFVKKTVEEILSSNEKQIDIEEYCKIRLKEIDKTIDNLELADILSSVVNRIKRSLNRRIEDLKQKGVTPPYEFCEYLPNTLLTYELLYGKDELSFIRRYKKEILDAICKMTWRSFEFLCAHLLEINRMAMSGVGPGKKEGGVDFHGLLEMNKFSKDVLLKDVRIKIIGQAKRHYNCVVDDKEVRVFKTHCDELLDKRGTAIKKLPKWFVNLKAPVLPYFIITTKFRKGAITYAKENSIILKDGEQVVEDLIKSQHAKEWFSQKNGKNKFDEKLFMKFFQKDNVK